jgi:hypothetical protein
MMLRAAFHRPLVLQVIRKVENHIFNSLNFGRPVRLDLPFHLRRRVHLRRRRRGPGDGLEKKALSRRGVVDLIKYQLVDGTQNFSKNSENTGYCILRKWYELTSPQKT